MLFLKTQQHPGELEASPIHLKRKAEILTLPGTFWYGSKTGKGGGSKPTPNSHTTILPKFHALEWPRLWKYGVLWENDYSLEEPYPKKHKPCRKPPVTARSSLVLPSQEPLAQTSLCSPCGTSRPETSCDACWECAPRWWCCQAGDGTPESYWGSWWRQRGRLGCRLPVVLFALTLML